jgi:NTE family protein
MRGLAHLGVLQVMEEHDVPVDALAGTSMGGIIAGLYAAGAPLSELIAFFKKVGIIDIAAPDRQWRGLFGRQKMSRLLTDLLGREDVTFEELSIPVSVVAVDVEMGEMIILDKGPLIPALVATSAFPIFFSPVHHQGRWLVDGGVLNNLPVDVARRMGVDRVLAVNTPPSVNLSLEESEQERGLSLRNLGFFGSRTLDWKLPFLIAETSVGFTIRAINQARIAEYPPDLVLEIDLPNVGVFISGDNVRIIQAGREAALKHLVEIIALKTPLPWWRRRWHALARRLSER